MKEMDENERILAVELENVQAAVEAGQSETLDAAEVEFKSHPETEAGVATKASDFTASEKLEKKKRELVCV